MIFIWLPFCQSERSKFYRTLKKEEKRAKKESRTFFCFVLHFPTICFPVNFLNVNQLTKTLKTFRGTKWTFCESLSDQPWRFVIKLSMQFPQKCLETWKLVKSCVKGPSKVYDQGLRLLHSCFVKVAEIFIYGLKNTRKLHFQICLRTITEQ